MSVQLGGVFIIVIANTSILGWGRGEYTDCEWIAAVSWWSLNTLHSARLGQ